MNPFQVFQNCFDNDHADRAAELIRSGAVGIDAVDLLGTPILLMSARTRCHKIARMLLDSGADVHAKTTKCGKASAVHLAALNGDLAMIQLLHEYGADMDARTDKNETPISHAVSGADPASLLKIVEYLVRNGADINAVSTFGSTAMDMVIQRSEGSYHYKDYLFPMIDLGALITRKAFGKANDATRKVLADTFEVHEAQRRLQASSASIQTGSKARRLVL